MRRWSVAQSTQVKRKVGSYVRAFHLAAAAARAISARRSRVSFSALAFPPAWLTAASCFVRQFTKLPGFFASGAWRTLRQDRRRFFLSFVVGSRRATRSASAKASAASSELSGGRAGTGAGIRGKVAGASSRSQGLAEKVLDRLEAGAYIVAMQRGKHSGGTVVVADEDSAIRLSLARSRGEAELDTLPLATLDLRESPLTPEEQVVLGRMDRVVAHYLATHTLREVRAAHYVVALHYSQGNVSDAARKMGVTRRSIYLARERKARRKR